MQGWGKPGRIRVPVGDEAARWSTRGRCHRVLLIVHNVTSATRLLDVLPLFDGDVRIQALVTCTGSSAFQAGVAELFAGLELPVLPWEQAVETPVDLALSASFGGQLDAFKGRLAVLSHGVGYTKKLATPEHRNTGTPEHRNTGTPEHPRFTSVAAPVPVFGLSPDWLLADGVPFTDALVLSHPEQLDRLRDACPEAVPSAVFGGDPCFDRLLAARADRSRFRRALGVRRGQRLVLLNSTWNPESLFGDSGAEDVLPWLLSRLASELPADEYRAAAVLHPNIWHGHGPGQVRAWLDRARRGGLALVDPLYGWRQALIAADVVIGDHGAVSYYAAALGTPVLLGAAPLDGLDPRAPVAEFVRTAPRLDTRAPLRAQLDRVRAAHVPLPGPREFTTAFPGESATRLRAVFYDLLGLPEPDWPATLEPLPLPAYEPPSPTAPLRVLTRPLPGGAVSVRRYAEAGPGRPSGAAEYEPGAAPEAVHTAVHEETRDRAALEVADVVHRRGGADDPRLGPPGRWTAETLERYPHCGLAVHVTGPDSCVARGRDGGPALRLGAGPGADADPLAYAAALYARLAGGTPLGELLRHGLTVRTGASEHRVTVTPEDD
ncbi:hypothetical protein NX801_17810 [Streptomyces sp. LP05-1]|uniref:Translation initiation factor 2 n=1 Tax=Streptomyces pyxinae TaxID=2970734 RepID=A0ABT2CK84_9ACTN|nr:hypothetical protein [Streptomyces sp. LP05-1]MCS0637487.1 hypothetical protein [Streptomyces sp. LP05-1]